MVIHIDPKRIANPSAGTVRRDVRRQAADVENSAVFTAPKRSEVNYIPAPETLATLVNSAVAALRRGVFWDRGTIINLLV